MTDNLGVVDAKINQEDFTLSVAQHVLGLSDEFLGLTGAAADAERTLRFRRWVAENTVTGADGKPVLRFNFTTSLVDNGIFSNVIQQGYNRFWLFQIGGIGQPKAGSNGVGMNLITAQDGLGYRRVAMTQSGTTHLRTFAGCIFDFRPLALAALVGGEWPVDQPAEAATTDFKASVNGANGERSAASGRPVMATDWRVEVFAALEVGLPDLDLQQLTGHPTVVQHHALSREDTGALVPKSAYAATSVHGGVDTTAEQADSPEIVSLPSTWRDPHETHQTWTTLRLMALTWLRRPLSWCWRSSAKHRRPAWKPGGCPDRIIRVDSLTVDESAANPLAAPHTDTAAAPPDKLPPLPSTARTQALSNSTMWPPAFSAVRLG
ncbi:MAG: hypothetical protein R2854_11570 [Caldilineaceae bacterium]